MHKSAKRAINAIKNIYANIFIENNIKTEMQIKNAIINRVFMPLP